MIARATPDDLPLASVVATFDPVDRPYGIAAVTLGAFLLWYALWTIECTTLVLLQAHFAQLLWAPLPPTLITAFVVYRYGGRLVRLYGRAAASEFLPLLPTFRRRDWMLAASVFLIAAIAADIGMRISTVLALWVALGCSVLLLSSIERGATFTRLADRGAPARSGVKLAILAVLLFVLYYCADRYDADDANYINMAIGAKRTAGAIYQFDTMIGDGPNPIHLPTYKFHSYELLGAVLSAYTGLSAIAVIQLALPAITLLLTAAFLFVALKPVAGRYWFVASVFALAFLFANDGTYASWGIHGIIRFQQGKGFLITVLLPLIAVLTVRWFVKRQPIDLVALALANVCALGFSANGLYGGPAASGFVAVAFVASQWRSPTAWKNALALGSTIVWPIIVAVLIVSFKLSLPSEVTHPGLPIAMLNFVAGREAEGRVLIGLIILSPLAFFGSRLARPALLYVPCAMVLALNPVGVAVINAVSGNLGFRIFWSMPAMLLIALLLLRLLLMAGFRSERVIGAIALLALAGGITSVAIANDPATRVVWHAPSIKVDLADWPIARHLASITPRGCELLAPEKFSALVTQMEDAPYPVFARRLYLIHYRFTLPPANLALRERLRRIVEGDGTDVAPSPGEIAAQGLHIGTIAIPADAAALGSARRLAEVLHLHRVTQENGVYIWTGPCDTGLP